MGPLPRCWHPQILPNPPAVLAAGPRLGAAAALRALGLLAGRHAGQRRVRLQRRRPGPARAPRQRPRPAARGRARRQPAPAARRQLVRGGHTHTGDWGSQMSPGGRGEPWAGRWGADGVGKAGMCPLGVAAGGDGVRWGGQFGGLEAWGRARVPAGTWRRRGCSGGCWTSPVPRGREVRLCPCHSGGTGQGSRVWPWSLQTPPYLSHCPPPGCGRLSASWEPLCGPSKPSPVAAQFSSEGSTLSGVEVELASAGYRMSLVKKRFATGMGGGGEGRVPSPRPWGVQGPLPSPCGPGVHGVPSLECTGSCPWGAGGPFPGAPRGPSLLPVVLGSLRSLSRGEWVVPSLLPVAPRCTGVPLPTTLSCVPPLLGDAPR